MPSGKGVGTRLKLRPWQKRILRGIYQTVDAEHRRVCRQAIISMARKNGKTALIAGLVLAHLCGPEAEINGEIYCAAASAYQAGQVFKYCKQIIEKTPELTDLVIANQLNVTASQMRLSFTPLGTFFQVLSKAPDTAHGFNPSLVIMDEMAQWKNASLYDVLTSGFGAREEPLEIVISTQAATDQHLLSTLIDYGLKCMSGEVHDPATRCWLFTAPVTDAKKNKIDPFSRKAQRAANPALGDFLSIKDMDNAATKARGMPSREALYRNLKLNQRISAHQQFLLSSDWDACNAEPGPCNGRAAWGGLDLSSVVDLTAACKLVEPYEKGQPLEVHMRFWMPEDGIRERSVEDNVPYDIWAKEGLISLTPGRAINRDFVAKELFEFFSDVELQSMAYDRWRIDELTQRMDAIDAALPMTPWGQGFKDMGGAIDELETLVVEQKLAHGGHKVLRMCIANAVATRDPTDARKLDKAKSHGRIDGAQAIAMAVGLRARGEADAPPAHEVPEGFVVPTA